MYTFSFYPQTPQGTGVSKAGSGSVYKGICPLKTPRSSHSSQCTARTGETFPLENKCGKRMGNRRSVPPVSWWLLAIDGQHVRPLLTPIKLIWTTWLEVFPLCVRLWLTLSHLQIFRMFYFFCENKRLQKLLV